MAATGSARRAKGAWDGVAGLAIAGGLLGLSLVGFLGAASALPAGTALTAIREGRPVTGDQLARAVAATRRALRWGARPADSLSDLALLKLVQARTGDVSEPESSRFVRESLAAQEAGLARAPANADGWARLTYARYSRSGLDDSSRDALAMSFLTGRLERPPMIFRVQIILQEWQAADSEMRALAMGQIRELARDGPRALDSLVDFYLGSHRAARDAITQALVDIPEGRAGFERRLQGRMTGE